MPLKITSFTQKIEAMAIKSKPVYWVLSQYYRKIVKNEVALAGITASDHVLCVGGGICPSSAILLHQHTGAKITVIDNNEICVTKAQETIADLGLDAHINVVYQDGGCDKLPLEQFSVVHFALQVTPMWHVFSSIERRVANGTKLLVRRPKKSLQQLYCHLAAHACEFCRHTVHKGVRNIGTTLLYVKQAA